MVTQLSARHQTSRLWAAAALHLLAFDARSPLPRMPSCCRSQVQATSSSQQVGTWAPAAGLSVLPPLSCPALASTDSLLTARPCPASLAPAAQLNHAQGCQGEGSQEGEGNQREEGEGPQRAKEEHG